MLRYKRLARQVMILRFCVVGLCVVGILAFTYGGTAIGQFAGPLKNTGTPRATSEPLPDSEVSKLQTSSRTLKSLQQWAPEQCVFYSCWAGWDDFEPQRSSTERWLGQPELVAFFEKLHREALLVAKHELSDQEFKRLELWLPWLEAIAASPTSVAVYRIPADKSGDANQLPTLCIVSDLGDRAEDIGRRLKTLLQESNIENQRLVIQQQEFHLVYIESLPRCYFGFVQNRLVIATNRDALELLHQDFKTPAPGWLLECSKQYAGGYQTGLTHLDLLQLQDFLRPGLPEEAGKLLDVLDLRRAKELNIVSSVQPEGTVLRGGLRVDLASGIFPLLQAIPELEMESMAAIDARVDQVHSLGLPLPKLSPFVRNCAEKLQIEDPTSEPIEQLRNDVGVDLEALLHSLSGRITLYGKLSMPFPQRGWVLSIGISDGDAFAIEFAKLAEYFQKHPTVSMSQEERDGRVVYHFEANDDFFVVVDDSELLVSANRRTLSKHWKRKESTKDQLELQREAIAEIGGLGDVFDQAFLGSRQYLYLGTSDLRPYFELGYSVLPLLFPEPAGHSQLSFQDFPTIDVLLNYWEPSVLAVYLREDGIDFYAKQTVPSMSQGILTSLFLLGVAQYDQN